MAKIIEEEKILRYDTVNGKEVPVYSAKTETIITNTIGAGLGTAVQGGSASDIATNAMLGYGIGSLGGMAMKGAGMSFGKLGAQTAAQGLAGIANAPGGFSGASALKASEAAASANTPSFLSGVGNFVKDNKLLTGALGLGALGALGSSLLLLLQVAVAH